MNSVMTSTRIQFFRKASVTTVATLYTAKGAQSQVTHPVEQNIFTNWSQVTGDLAQFVPLCHMF